MLSSFVLSHRSIGFLSVNFRNSLWDVPKGTTFDPSQCGFLHKSFIHPGNRPLESYYSDPLKIPLSCFSFHLKTDSHHLNWMTNEGRIKTFWLCAKRHQDLFDPMNVILTSQIIPICMDFYVYGNSENRDRTNLLMNKVSGGPLWTQHCEQKGVITSNCVNNHGFEWPQKWFNLIVSSKIEMGNLKAQLLRSRDHSNIIMHQRVL